MSASIKNTIASPPEGRALAYTALTIGVSAGGFNALGLLLPALPAAFPLPVIVVQHRMDTGDNFLIQFLDEKCALRVKEADDKEPLKAGIIYLAPAGYHLLVEKEKHFSLSIDPPVNYSRPSIDVLFESAAEAYGAGLIGVILTGANHDGSQGLRLIRSHGGLTIAQDPADAEARAMPTAAIATGAVQQVLPLVKIAPLLIHLTEVPHG